MLLLLPTSSANLYIVSLAYKNTTHVSTLVFPFKLKCLLIRRGTVYWRWCSYFLEEVYVFRCYNINTTWCVPVRRSQVAVNNCWLCTESTHRTCFYLFLCFKLCASHTRTAESHQNSSSRLFGQDLPNNTVKNRQELVKEQQMLTWGLFVLCTTSFAVQTPTGSDIPNTSYLFCFVCFCLVAQLEHIKTEESQRG